jgi:hypothetical protein
MRSAKRWTETRGRRRRRRRRGTRRRRGEREEKDIPEPASYPTHPSISLNPDETSIPYLFEIVISPSFHLGVVIGPIPVYINLDVSPFLVSHERLKRVEKRGRQGDDIRRWRRMRVTYQ